MFVKPNKTSIFSVEDRNDEMVKRLREFVKCVNRTAKMKGCKDEYYVKLQGRLGVDNPCAFLYSCGAYSYTSIALAHAQHYDVYVYQRHGRVGKNHTDESAIKTFFKCFYEVNESV